MTTQSRVAPTGRVAVVTGAARGIGAAIARRLAGQGIAVAAVDLDTEGSARTANAILEAGGRAIAVGGTDVADESAAGHAVERAAAELGPVTVLVNNAGIIRDNLLFKMSTGDWDAVMDVHLRGAFLMTRAAQAHMIEAKWGRIVNLSSTSALGNRGQANYAAAKAGLIGMSKALAREVASRNITVNCVAPGLIDTAMTAVLNDKQKNDLLEAVPAGRFGTADETAAAVVFLASAEAAYVTGQTLHVNGGMAMI
jgi:3-oxoacyl-[acyl-carrier protein] reductase